jgi:hypothetical protein
MQIDSGVIDVGICLVVVAIFSAVEQRRAAKETGGQQFGL